MIYVDFDNFEFLIDVSKLNLKILNSTTKLLKIKIPFNRIIFIYVNNEVDYYFIVNDGHTSNIDDLTHIHARDFFILTTESNKYIYYRSQIYINFIKNTISSITNPAISFGLKEYYIVNNVCSKNVSHFEKLKLSYIRKMKINKCLI